MEDAATEGERDECGLALEDLLFLANKDKDRSLWLVNRYVKRVEILKNPCNFAMKIFKPSKCKVE